MNHLKKYIELLNLYDSMITDGGWQEDSGREVVSAVAALWHKLNKKEQQTIIDVQTQLYNKRINFN